MELPFSAELWLDGDVPAAQRRAAERRFATALAESLGDATLVMPTYRSFLRIVAAHGCGSAADIAAEDLPDAERHVFESWRIAEGLALATVFGPHRQMGEALYELHAATAQSPGT